MLTRRAFLSSAASAPLAAQSGRRPNFIVLFADDMGYGDLACYGHPTLRTPNIDRMAAEGVRFTSFYAAAPFCTPSRAGLLTGRYPMRAGQPNNLGPDSVGGLPLSEITLAQLLKKQGYKTAAAGKWHLGHNPPEYLPTSRGFDSYLGLLYSNDMLPPFVKTDKPLELYRDTKPIEHPVDQSTLTERYTAEAVRFIRSAGRDPFFLYLPYAMPHLPISASARFRGRSRAGLYGDVIETLDWSAGEILQTLKAQGIDQNTMVVFTSDNGPWLNLPGRMLQSGNEPWHAGTKNLLRGSKGGTYEGGIRVPCLARWPGVIPERQVNADIACTMDLFATIASAAGISLPNDRVYDGLNILPVMQGKTKSPRNVFYYFRGPMLEGVREGSWKLRFARDARSDLKPGDPITAELFDLDVDPAEQYNLYSRNRETGDRLLANLRAFAASLKANLPV
ncbi:MAG: sulfatase [Bryobacteraceae bacterium]|nr:sulfatase [Bryobacteraceae bacterium]